MKTFKEFIKEEGYDIARDMGRVPKTKDKKDATSYPPSEEMKKLRKVNKGPSALERVKADIRKRGEKIMGEAKVDMGKDDASKINTRNQRTFGNRRGQKGGMHRSDDMEARRYNTEKGRGVKMRGKKDKTHPNYLIGTSGYRKNVMDKMGVKKIQNFDIKEFINKYRLKK